jgi:hypothetical protein
VGNDQRLPFITIGAEFSCRVVSLSLAMGIIVILFIILSYPPLSTVESNTACKASSLTLSCATKHIPFHLPSSGQPCQKK